MPEPRGGDQPGRDPSAVWVIRIGVGLVALTAVAAAAGWLSVELSDHPDPVVLQARRGAQLLAALYAAFASLALFHAWRAQGPLVRRDRLVFAGLGCIGIAPMLAEIVRRAS